MAMLEREFSGWLARVTTLDPATLLLDVWAPAGPRRVHGAAVVPREGLTREQRDATCQQALARALEALRQDADRKWVVPDAEPADVAERVALLIRDADRAG